MENLEIEDGVLRGDKLEPNATDILNYQRDLTRLVRDMTKIAEPEMVRFYVEEIENKGLTPTTTAAALIFFAGLKFKLAAIVEERAPFYISSMVARISRTSNRALSLSLKKIFGKFIQIKAGENVRSIMPAVVAQNIHLIKSIEAKYVSNLESALMRAITTTNKEEFVQALIKQKGISRRHAIVVAEDQVHKTYENLSFRLMEDNGIEEFEWVYTFRSKQRRDLHVRMNGNIYRLDDLPVIDEKTGQKGKPGDLYNCKCGHRPVFRLRKK